MTHLNTSHILIIVISGLLISCKNNEKTKTYESVKIGDQVWMINNLNEDSFRNGDLIDQINSIDQWIETTDNERPGWCYYNNESKDEKYGKIYNWYAVNDPRGLCPKGWHVPSKDEVEELIKYLGGQDSSGAKMKTQKGWGSNGNGTNSSGFSAIPGKSRGANGSFEDFDHLYSNWWLSSKADYGEASAWSMAVDANIDKLLLYEIQKQTGYHVRCLKD